MEKTSFRQIVSYSVIFLCASLIIILSLLIFFTRQVNYAAWIQNHTIYYRMSYTTALCFMLLGMALIGTFFHWVVFTRILAVIVILESSYALIANIVDVHWMDYCNILSISGCFSEYSYLHTSIITALCFIAFAIAYWKNSRRRAPDHSWIFYMSVVGVSALALSIIFLFGYVVHSSGNLLIDPIIIRIAMSANTAVVMFIFGAVTSLLAADFASTAKFNLKKFIPTLSALFIAVLSLLFWHFLLSGKQTTYLPLKLALLTLAREFITAALVGLAIYFAQTARQLSKEANRHSAFTKAILESLAEGIFVIDSEKKIVDTNQRLLKMWNIPPYLSKETQFSVIHDYVASQVKDPVMFQEKMNEVLKFPNEIGRGEVNLKNGSIFEFTTYPEFLDTKVVGQVCSFHDITHLKQAESQLRFQATHDALTGLANRYYLSGFIEKAIARAKREGYLVAVLFLDLDRFKQVNDSLGHDIGDLLLKAVSLRLLECTRAEDSLARVGGDEFVLLMGKISSMEDITRVMKRFQDYLTRAFYIENHKLYLNTSIGISLYPKDGNTPEALLKNADIAMYHAKKTGQHYQFYEEKLEMQIINHLTLENELRHSLTENRLVLRYQPIIDLQTGTIVGTEALIRWLHPTKGIMQPIDFISLAEETNLIHEMGEWVLRTACAQNKAWNALVGDLKISVNVSPLQLQDINFSEKVENILKETDLNPNLLELEITESVFIKDFLAMQSIYHKLKKIGVGFAIDDFGTGYSSLNYLRNLPLDTIKIDKTFLDDIPRSAQAKAIVIAILALAESLKLFVIAEGIEHHDQVTFLKLHGCTLGQGFYFSQPLSSEEYEKAFPELQKKLGGLLAN